MSTALEEAKQALKKALAHLDKSQDKPQGSQKHSADASKAVDDYLKDLKASDEKMAALDEAIAKTQFLAEEPITEEKQKKPSPYKFKKPEDLEPIKTKTFPKTDFIASTAEELAEKRAFTTNDLEGKMVQVATQMNVEEALPGATSFGEQMLKKAQSRIDEQRVSQIVEKSERADTLEATAHKLATLEHQEQQIKDNDELGRKEKRKALKDIRKDQKQLLRSDDLDLSRKEKKAVEARAGEFIKEIKATELISEISSQGEKARLAAQVSAIEQAALTGELTAETAQNAIESLTGKKSKVIEENEAKKAQGSVKKAAATEKKATTEAKKKKSVVELQRAKARSAKEVGQVVYKCRQLAGCSMDPTYSISDLAKMREQLNKTPFNSSDNTNVRGTLESDVGSDGLANRSGAVIRLMHLATGYSVSFKAFVSEYSDRFESNWNKQDVFGRVDPVVTYQSTHRTIQLGWAVPSFGVCEAICNFERVSWLMKMLYPEYRGISGTRNVAGVVSAPLLKLEFSNMITSMGVAGGLTVASSGFNMEPDLEMGFFSDDLGNYYPKVINLSSNFTVLHNHNVGWRRKGKYRDLSDQMWDFPYNIKPSRVESLPFEKATKKPRDTTDAATAVAATAAAKGVSTGQAQVSSSEAARERIAVVQQSAQTTIDTFNAKMEAGGYPVSGQPRGLGTGTN